jgi:hypothetical protein
MTSCRLRRARSRQACFNESFHDAGETAGVLSGFRLDFCEYPGRRGVSVDAVVVVVVVVVVHGRDEEDATPLRSGRRGSHGANVMRRPRAKRKKNARPGDASSATRAARKKRAKLRRGMD